MGEPVLSTEQTQRSLWLGDLPPWIDEGFLFNLFAGTNQLVSVKLIRNRATGASEGYAFLEFRTHEAADSILKTYNGHPIPGTELVFRLNWAAFGVGKAQPGGEDFSLFVGDLAPDVSDVILQEYFRQFYPSVRSAKVITDATTGRSKGYGFVRFTKESERDRALGEMNGHFLSNRPIRVSLATARKNPPNTNSVQQTPHPSDFDPTNTTLFIGGLSSTVTEDQLRVVFGRFGDIIYVKIPQGKGCGFVQFVLRTSAERAMTTMQGQLLGNSAIRISWGRSSSRAANQAVQLATLAGLPAGFPGQFADPALLAAAGAFNGQFGPSAGFPGLTGGDPAAAAAAAAAMYGSNHGHGPLPPGATPADMGLFGGFLPGMGANPAFNGLNAAGMHAGPPFGATANGALHDTPAALAAAAAGAGAGGGVRPGGGVDAPSSSGPSGMDVTAPMVGTIQPTAQGAAPSSTTASDGSANGGGVNGHMAPATNAAGSVDGDLDGLKGMSAAVGNSGAAVSPANGSNAATAADVGVGVTKNGNAGLVGAHLFAGLLA